MPPKKSKEQHLLQGTYQPCRHDKKTLQVPPVTGIADNPPSYLKKEARREWLRVAPSLEQAGTLTIIDISALAFYCQMFARWRKAADDVDKRGDTIIQPSGRISVNPSVKLEALYGAAMVKSGTKFGLNPLDRPRVIVNPDVNKEPDLLERFLAGEDIDDTAVPVVTAEDIVDQQKAAYGPGGPRQHDVNPNVK